MADGMFAAGLAARRPADEPLIVEPGDSAAFLAPYSVAVLDQPELAGILDRLGVRTLGALAALPVGEVGARFGPDGLLAHRLARGLDPRPPAPRRPAEELAVEHDFDPPAERDEPVLFVAKMLADTVDTVEKHYAQFVLAARDAAQHRMDNGLGIEERGKLAEQRGRKIINFR